MDTLLLCIQKETEAMALLVDVLQQEQALLTEAPGMELMEEIGLMTQKKTQIISQISHIGQTRQTELTRLGLNPTTKLQPDWLQNPAQTASWKELINQTEKANELNRVNGLLITRHLNRNQNALQVLFAGHQNTMPGLYSASGQSDTPKSLARGVVA